MQAWLLFKQSASIRPPSPRRVCLCHVIDDRASPVPTVTRTIRNDRHRAIVTLLTAAYLLLPSQSVRSATVGSSLRRRIPSGRQDTPFTCRRWLDCCNCLLSTSSSSSFSSNQCQNLWFKAVLGSMDIIFFYFFDCSRRFWWRFVIFIRRHLTIWLVIFVAFLSVYWNNSNI